MSFPFYNKQFTFTQPDGTQIKVRGWGDQHHAVFETLDGFTIVKDPSTRFYTYAKLTEDGKELESTGVKIGLAPPGALGIDAHLHPGRDAAKKKAMAAYGLMQATRRCEIRRQRAKAALRAMLATGGPFAAPPAQQTTGQYVGLCLLIQFPDEVGTIPQSEVEDFCNKQGYNGYGNNGSVYDYFYDNSNGKLQYTNMVTGYYTAVHERSYYTDPNVAYGTRARELIIQALTDLKDQGFDFSQLSADDEFFPAVFSPITG